MTQMRSSVKGFRQVRKRQPRFQPWRVSLCSRRGGWNSYLVSYLVSLSQPGRVNTWRLSFHNCRGVTEKAESHVGLPDIKGNGLHQICFWKALCSHNGCLLLCLCGPRKAHLTFAHHSETTICKGAARYLLTQLPGQSLVEKQVLDCWVGWRTFLKKKKKTWDVSKPAFVPHWWQSFCWVLHIQWGTSWAKWKNVLCIWVAEAHLQGAWMEDGNRPGGPQCPRVCPPSLHCDLHPPDKKWHFFPPKKLSPLGSRPWHEVLRVSD